jgi:FKBP-type peptidyl-prolyl cis-trans isomerase SlyD
MNMAESLQEKKIGALEYNIYIINEDGSQELLESVSADEALEYLHGYENIVPGLENALEGKTVDDAFDVTVTPENGYGEYDEDLIEELDRDDFDFDEEDDMLEVGMEIEMLDEDGDIVEGTIKELRGDVVVVDLNPPLAGQTIRYQGRVVAVRDATEEELEWGFPESLLDEMFGDDDHFHDDDDDE